MRDWVANVADTYYLLGSVLGPHPYPLMVREFQSVIGQEARAQILAQAGRLPDVVVACVGGGSNSMGLFDAFVDDERVRLVGVEAGGRGIAPAITPRDSPAARRACCTARAAWCCRTRHGNILPTHSVSAGLDYASIGPEHAWLAATRADRVRVDRRRGCARRLRVAGASAKASCRRSSRRTRSPG